MSFQFMPLTSHPSFIESAEHKRPGLNGILDSRQAVQVLLFLMEYPRSPRSEWKKEKRCLGFFFNRHGGLHLLLMLLNAYYHKPMAGRRAGWVFSALERRINISERSLRTLIQNAVAEGLIEPQSIEGASDRRCRSYQLAPQVVEAWEVLTASMQQIVSDVLQDFDPGELANVDYRLWDPDLPAGEQRSELPPHRLPGNKSIS